VTPELPAVLSSPLAQHLTLGCSTGFMDEHRNDWVRLVDESAAWSSIAIELSAISAEELPGLLAYLDGAPRLPFLFISVHAPSKGFIEDEARLVEELCRVPAWVDTIVIHPDTISDPGQYRRLGRRLAIENMDTRKQAGHTAEDLDAVFAELPEARLCLDLAHAKDVDPTLAVAADLLQRFASRLSHVHLSSLDEAQHHITLTDEDQLLFRPLLDRCRDVPWILEARPPW
jgi:hypothetical protein